MKKKLISWLTIAFFAVACNTVPCPECPPPCPECPPSDTITIPYAVHDTVLIHDTVFVQNPSGNFLYVTSDNLIAVRPDSVFKFNIVSNTYWMLKSSATWLTISVEIFYTKEGHFWKTMPYSGSAPDIGAFEYPQDWASGRDTAFVTLTARGTSQALTPRNATVTISGTDIKNKIINVIQN